MDEQFIINTVLSVMNLQEKKNLVFSKSKETKFVKARQFIHYFTKKYVKSLSLKLVGDITKNDHATVIYSIKCISNLEDQKWHEYIEVKRNIFKVLQTKCIKIDFDTWNYSNI